MLELQLAMLTGDNGIVPDLLDMSVRQKDFLATAALKSGNTEIRECVIESMINDHKLADALDAAMFGSDSVAILNDIRNSLYGACESEIQNAIDTYNESVREQDADFHGTKNSDFM